MYPHRGQQTREPQDDFDDSASISSGISSDGLIGEVKDSALDTVESIDDFRDKLFSALEGISEKRTTSRVTALKKLIKLMASRNVEDMISGHSETMVLQLLTCFRKSKKEDAVLAGRALSILAITLGSDNQSLYNETKKVLAAIVKTGNTVSVRASATTTLAIVAFVSSTEIECTVECMDMFAKVFGKVAAALARIATLDESITDKSVSNSIKQASRLHPAVVCTALNGWGLLATTRDKKWLVKDCFNMFTPIFCQLLDHDSLEVRAAAGENTALLIQNRLDYRRFSPTYSSKGKPMKKRRSSLIASKMSERLKAASHENHRHRSKKQLKEQRAIFRDICRTLDGGDSPDVTLKIRGETIVFDSWAAIKQLQAFRNCLGPGITPHIVTNQLLRDVFDLGPVPNVIDSVKKMSRLEKRMFRSPNSEIAKARTQKRTKERSKRQQQKLLFMMNTEV